MKIMSTNNGDFRGKRAELNVYDDACGDDLIPIDCPEVVYLKRYDVISADLMNKLIEFEKSFDMEYIVNKSHKDQDGVTIIDDFRIMGMSIVEDENKEYPRVPDDYNFEVGM